MPPSALTGTRLRTARIALGLRQGEVARRAEISASYLNLIEHNRRKIDGALLQRLADVLGQAVAAFHDDISGALLEELRSAAGGSAVMLEGERVEEFANRYPGWAQLLAEVQHRNAGLQRSLSALNDRMTQDPHLSASLHEVISAVSSLRSTTGILVETDDLEPEWRLRFHANLAQDSERLATGARALVSYLEGFEQAETSAIASPQEEVEVWMAGMEWTLAGRVGKPVAKGEVQSQAARQMAQGWLDVVAADLALLPDAGFAAAVTEFGPDPVQIAARMGTDVLPVFRRLALMPRANVGLVLCDASGTIVFRKPIDGFALPRFGAACPLWPLFTALGRPMTPIETVIETPAPVPRRFLVRAFCQPSHPGGFHGPELRSAAMIILPDIARVGAAQPIGSTCRTCPRASCPARREPSIVTS